MKLSATEKAARKAAFRAMSSAEKLEYIYTYYKWLILLALLTLVLLGSFLHRELTRKEPVLYLGFANVAVGEDLEAKLSEAYLRFEGLSPKKQEVYLYKDLYLSDNADVLNHEYAYASRMKLMGAIQAQKLDAVIMNREAYDLLSAAGYLTELPALLAEADPELAREIAPLVTANTVVLEDNSIDWQLGEAEEHRVLTEEAENGIALEGLPLFRAAGFEEPLYFGLLANSQRADAAVRYLRYLSRAPQESKAADRAV